MLYTNTLEKSTLTLLTRLMHDAIIHKAVNQRKMRETFLVNLLIFQFLQLLYQGYVEQMYLPE